MSTPPPEAGLPFALPKVMRSSWKAMRRLAGVVALATVTLGALARDAAAETLSLSQAIDIGLKKSPQVLGAKARTDAAESGTTMARGGYLPQLAVQGGVKVIATGFDGSLPYAGANGQRLEARSQDVNYTTQVPIVSTNVTWNLYDFGKTSNSVAAADAFRDTTAFQEKETTLTSARDIASAYLNLYYQERLLEVQTATLQTRDKLNAITKGMVRSGLRPPMEEIRAGSRLEAARRDLERQRAATEDARTQLAVALGMEPNAAIKTTTPRLARLALDTDGAVREATEKRPQLLAASKDLERAQAEKDRSTSQLLPTVQVVANGYMFVAHPDGGRDDREFRQITRGGDAALQLVERFDFTALARTNQASADLAAAEQALEAVRRDTKSDAVRAVIQVRSTASQLEHAKKTEEGTQAVHALVEASYIRGLASPLELIDAEDSDFDARVQRVLTERDHAFAIVQLCVATGRPITEESAQ